LRNKSPKKWGWLNSVMYQRPFRAIVGWVSVAACASLVGCTHLVEGTSSYHPENTVEHLTLVKNAELPSLVLQAPEVSGVMKADLDAVAIYSNVGPKPGVADQKCAGAVAAGAEPMYRGSGYAAVTGLGLVGEDDRAVDEGVVAFGDAAAAREFVETRLHQWKDCTNKVLTLTSPDGQTTHWVAQGPTTSYGVGVLQRTQEGTSGYACSHGLAARSNVVADVLACSHDTASLNDQVAAIANKMLGTIQR
jgi:serine/threonine kinase PknH